MTLPTGSSFSHSPPAPQSPGMGPYAAGWTQLCECVGLLSSALVCMDTAHVYYGISLYFYTLRFQLYFPPAGLCHSSLSPFGVPCVPGAHAQPSPQGCSPALPSVWGRGQTPWGCVSLYFFPSSPGYKNAFKRWKMILHFPNWLRFPSICNKSLLFLLLCLQMSWN